MTAAILGAGSWGTALAIHLARHGVGVRLWARDPAIASGIRARRRNPYYLEGVELPDRVVATTDVAEAVGAVDVLLVAVPSEFVAQTLEGVPALRAGAVAVSATKGFDPERHLRMSELIGERFPEASVAVLSGPTFAREVAHGQPTAAVVASADEALAIRLRDAWGTREFRLYTNRDVAGVEIGGAMKNAIALATGLGDGLGLGENARAALITRGLAEITRLGVALGAKGGDARGPQWPRRSGSHLHGEPLAQPRPGHGSGAGPFPGGGAGRHAHGGGGGSHRADGADAGPGRGVSVPICEAVGAVLFEGRSPREALAALLARAATREDAPRAPGGRDA